MTQEIIFDIGHYLLRDLAAPAQNAETSKEWNRKLFFTQEIIFYIGHYFLRDLAARAQDAGTSECRPGTCALRVLCLRVWCLG